MAIYTTLKELKENSTVVVKSLEDYLERTDGFINVSIFRGLRNCDYELIPNAGRTDFGGIKGQVYHERKLLNEFITRSPIYLEKEPTTAIEWLILAQHHGIPTRLMDWSFNPLVALFFAVGEDDETDCVVYQSSITSRKPIINNVDDIFSNTLYATIVPPFTHIRYIHQASLFSIHPDPKTPHYSSILSRYIIPADKKVYIRQKLRQLGITKSYIFNNLDSLAFDIMDEVKPRFAEKIITGDPPARS